MFCSVETIGDECSRVGNETRTFSKCAASQFRDEEIVHAAMMVNSQTHDKGFIQLAQRSGQYETINATDIREGEIEDENLLTGEIKFKKLSADKRSAAKVVGYAAHFRLLNGFQKTLYMTKEEIDEHAKKYSQSYRNDKYGSSLWNTQFDTMAKKTVIKLLISKYGPLSIEMQMAQKFDQSVVGENAIDNIEDAEAQYVDNIEEVVEEEPSKTKSSVMAAASELFNEEKK